MVAQKKKQVRLPFTPEPCQRRVWDSHARIKVVVAGRRFGKTWLAAALAIRKAIKKPKATIWWVAPTLTLAGKGWRVLTRDFLRGAPGVVKRLRAGNVEFPNGSTIWIKSADNPETLVSEGLDLLVVDEAARVSERAWEESLRPTLLDTQGEAVFISTPKGYNWFYYLYADALKAENTHMEAWRFRSADAAHIKDEWVDHERQQCAIPRYFEQEYLAEFVESVGSVFRGVRDCIGGDLVRPPGPEEPKLPVVIGVDWGKRQDASVFSVMDVSNGRLVDWHRLTHLGYEEQMQRLKALVRAWCPLALIVEQNSQGDPLVDRLEAEIGGDTRIHPIQINNTRKAELIENLVLAIETKIVHYPNLAELIEELEAYQYGETATGKVRYSAPEGERFQRRLRNIAGLRLVRRAKLHCAHTRATAATPQGDRLSDRRDSRGGVWGERFREAPLPMMTAGVQ